MTLPTRNQRREPRAAARVLHEWTPALLRAAEVTAEQGELRVLAELCEALRGDPRVRAALETRVRGLVRLPIAFVASGDGRRKGRVVRALEAEEDFWTMCPESELVELLSWVVMLGIGVARLEWAERGSRLVPTLRARDPRHLRWDWQTRRWLLRVDDGATEVEVVPGDREWVLLTLGAGSRPWRHGAWKALRKYWLGRELSWSDLLRAGEVDGSPARIGIPPEGASDDVCQEVCNDLAAIGASASYVPPPGWDLKILEGTSQTWKLHPVALQIGATEVAIAITGQNLSTEVTAGVGTGATLHANVREDLIGADGEQTATGTHEQILVPWAEVNFGDAALAPWALWDTEPPAKKLARIQALKTFGDALQALRAALEGSGLTPDPAAIRELAAEHGLALIDTPAGPS